MANRLKMAKIPFLLIHEFYPQNAGFNLPGVTRMAFKIDKEGYVSLPPGRLRHAG
jgi:hypothetical protein